MCVCPCELTGVANAPVVADRHAVLPPLQRPSSTSAIGTAGSAPVEFSPPPPPRTAFAASMGSNPLPAVKPPSSPVRGKGNLPSATKGAPVTAAVRGRSPTKVPWPYALAPWRARVLTRCLVQARASFARKLRQKELGVPGLGTGVGANQVRVLSQRIRRPVLTVAHDAGARYQRIARQAAPSEAFRCTPPRFPVAIGLVSPPCQLRVPRRTRKTPEACGKSQPPASGK